MAAINAISKLEYRGNNAKRLSAAKFTDNRFLTFNQARELGGNVKRGEHGYLIEFAGRSSSENSNGDKVEGNKVYRCYTVFNIEQCEFKTE